MGNYISEAKPQYEKALQKGKKEGGAPAILDLILEESGFRSFKEVYLGLQDIALDQIAGTKSLGRQNCFSKSFYPIMSKESEFYLKWVNLCASHLAEGIQDPIKVYEYLGEYYVLEGNKRVSVLKSFDAFSISAEVTRMIPPLIDRPDIRLYYEYMDFYNLTKINYLYFSNPGNFSKLQRYVGKSRNDTWSSEDRREFDSVYMRFRMEYTKQLGPQSFQNISDAFLSFMGVFDYPKLKESYSLEMREMVKKYEPELKILLGSQTSKLMMDPSSKRSGFFLNLLPKSMLKQKVAFIHDKTPINSGWTFHHDQGRLYIEQSYPEYVSTTVYNDTDLDHIKEVLDEAIKENHQVIFTTSPIFLKETLRAAIDHPEIKFLNCTTHTSFKQVRTYYARMYEVNFLLGAIAGSLSTNDKLGYLADYPIHGTLANINAFALGAKMVNPRAKVYLKWSQLQSDSQGNPGSLDQIYNDFASHDISILCDKDTQNLDQYAGRIGLYQVAPDGSIWNIAMPVWNWGVFYEKTIFNILNGTWKSEEHTEQGNGIHYWWGLSSNLVSIIHSSRLPIGTVRLIKLLQKDIQRGDFNPFTGTLYAQDRIIQADNEATLSPEDILSIDWLAENVIGEIPKLDQLTDKARLLASYIGLEKEELVL